MWALLCRCEKAKVALRGSGLLPALQLVEKQIVTEALASRATREAEAGAGDDRSAALRNLEALAILLGLDCSQLRAGP